MKNTLILTSIASLLAAFTTSAQETWNFQTDTVGDPPGMVELSRERAVENTIRVVGQSSDPADPFGGSDNQCLYYFCKSGDRRPPWADFAFDKGSALAAGTASFDLFLKSTGDSAGIIEVQIGKGGRKSALAAIQIWTNSDGRTPGLIRYFSGNTEGSAGLAADQRFVLDQKNTISMSWKNGGYSVEINGQPLTAGGQAVFGYANPEILEASVVRITTATTGAPSTDPNGVAAFVDNLIVHER